MPAVEPGRKESRRRPQDLIGPAQLPHLAFQGGDPLLVLGAGPGPLAAVHLGLANPGPERLGTDAQLPGHPGDHAEALPGLLSGLLHHAHRSLPQLGWIAPLGGVRASAVAAGLCHCSIFTSKRWSLQQTQYGSLWAWARRWVSTSRWVSGRWSCWVA